MSLALEISKLRGPFDNLAPEPFMIFFEFYFKPMKQPQKWLLLFVFSLAGLQAGGFSVSGPRTSFSKELTPTISKQKNKELKSDEKWISRNNFEKSNWKNIVMALDNGDDEPYDLYKQFRPYFEPQNRLMFINKQLECKFGGVMRADMYIARRAATLDKDFSDDAINQLRQRSELAFHLSHKMDQHRDRPVAEMRFTAGNVMFWRTLPSAYLMTNEIEFISTQYDKIFPPVRLNLQEAWLQVNLDQLISNNEPHQISVKAGFFPFLVGRGVSLGDWFNGGPYGFGFSKYALQSSSPKYPAGILFGGSIYKNRFNFDLYYSPSVTEEFFKPGGVVTSLPKGSLSDRHIFAGRLKAYRSFYNDSKTYLEPYFVYYNSPRNSMNDAFDSAIRVFTMGCMLDHKIQGFEVNVEAAKQIGRVKVRENINLRRPDQAKYLKRNSSGDLIFNPNTDAVKNNLAPTVNGNTVSYNTNLDASWDEFYTSNTPKFFEYHFPYEFDLGGYMATADVRYTFDKSPLQLMASVGYFSGDAYAWNDNVDEYFSGKKIDRPTSAQPLKTVKSFIALRDFDYNGLWALPMVMFNSGIVPRPYDMSLRDQFAINESDSASNIFYLTAGFAFSPTNDLEKFRVQPNICAYWTTADIRKWDTNAIQPSMVASEIQVKYSLSPVAQDKQVTTSSEIQRVPVSSIKGWFGSDFARKALGWEINCLANYAITERMEIAARFGAFFPGALYKDLSGQPNVNTMRIKNIVDPAGFAYTSTANNGLGTDTAWGFDVRWLYSF